MFNSRLINTKVAGGGGGCTDIVDNYDPFGGNGVALYQLNGDATDVSGNYDGTASNVTYGTGVFGQAGVFNGSSSKITTSLTQTNTSAWSWSLWININAKPSSGLISQIISNINGSSPFAGVVLVIDSPNLGIVSNGSNIWTTNTINPSLSTWYHIAITYNGSGIITPYINGQSYGAISHTPSNGNTLTIGEGDISSYSSFNGSIDQVRIFNTELDPLEVEALYTEELCICDGTVDTLDILGDGSCIATYQLDGNANDLSSNYSGTPTDVSYGVGEFDLAGVFNGSSSYVYNNDLDTSSTKAISIWVKASDFNERWAFQQGDGQGVENYIRFYNTDDIQVRIGNVTQTFSGYSANTWYHIVAQTNTSGNANVWINGVEVGTSTTPTPLTVNRTNIGARYNSSFGYQNYFNGSIDQVRIFNKALSAGEVTTLYNETACTKAACTGTTNTLDILGDGSCIATYPLDGSPADLSGNYNGVQTDVTYPVGYFDLAGSFNGSSSVVTDIYQMDFGQSFSMWVNIDDDIPDGTYYGLHSQWDDGVAAYTGTRLKRNSGNNYTIEAFIRDGNNYIYRRNTSVNLNEGWNNFVFIINTTTGYDFYLNGNNGNFTNWFVAGSWQSVNFASRTAFFGSYTSGLYFKGLIDQVRFFNKELNLAEVGILYNNETPCN